MEAGNRLRIAYTPNSQDTFSYEALETGRVALPDYELEFVCQPINVLNRAALRGQHDITTISSIFYPQITRRYAILSVGARVGRGYGPVLVSREPRSLAELAGKPVGVGGIPTTGWFLLRCLCPEAVPIEMPFDRIVEAVATGALEAGVMIHEEMLSYPRLGLHRVVDLGAEWCQRNGLPLPLSLNVIRRDLGAAVMQRLCATLRRSLRHALDHSHEALDRVSRFATEDAVCLPDDARMGLRVLLAQAADLGLAETVPPLDIVEASESSAPASLHAA